MTAYDPERLKDLVRQQSLRFGDFTLASGKKAKFYLDCRQLTLHPQGANQVGAGMLHLLGSQLPSAIGGMAIGADPITAATITLAGQRGLDLKGFIVRKEAKQHGMGRQVEGPVEAGETVVIVEDVVTSGGSALAAVEAARQFGLKVEKILAVIDRLEGGREAIEAAGLTLEILIDRHHVKTLTIEPPRGSRGHAEVDAHLKARSFVAAGAHAVGVTFIKKPSSLLETKRQPYNAHYNMHRHPRLGPAVYEVSITGPYPESNATVSGSEPGLAASAEHGSGAESQDSGNLRPLFLAPADASDSLRTAKEDLSRLMRLAYRRPVDEEDLREPLRFFETGRQSGGYEVGIEQALASILVSPNFLLKLEPAPASATAGSAYRINDLQLATRLSFFLWSSLPDDELLQLAESNRLHEPQVLEAQVLRMLKDQRSQSLVDNFAEQWLYLRNLDSITPDLRLFPDFDDNLRQAFRQETKLFFENVMREDRSVVDLLQADTTYLNERLAKHYGIPHIYGSRLRPVVLDLGSHRGGLLRQGSILTVTSYATRTSPVIRGHWILKNMIGSPPPPPPPDVPTLEDNTVSATLPMRARLAKHRANAACAACHNVMDPIGFALENYDAVGRWRDMEDGLSIDASGGLAGGIKVDGVDGLERALLAQPELFVSTMTEKLLTFALGRGVGVNDAPAVRRIVRSAESTEYRFSAIIQGIVASPPFQMRSVQ